MPDLFFPAAVLLASSRLPQRLSPADLAIVAVYLLGITLFGLRFRKRGGVAGTSLKSYFLADNELPWWAIALSVVSAETSTLTIVSVPGVAFGGNFGFLQIVIGYMLGRVVIAALFLPRYFAGEMLTAYQLIDRRFGPVLHKVTAGLFLLTRAAAEGVRVFAVSIVIGVAIGTGDVLSIALISLLTLLYTFEGGMAAVVWTDVVQMAIYVGGTAVALLSLGSHVQGGWSHIHAVAGAADKFRVFNFALNLTQSYTFWAGVLGGTFLTMASHGTDQLMVQRLLAARNLRESRLALLSSGAVIFLQFTLFLLIGAGLYVFYGEHAGTTFRSNDYIFPTFIVREMPVGIAGLLVAAILAAAMSNLSAALNSLSSTTVVDFYMRLRPEADTRECSLISKSSTVLWAVVLFAIAVYSLAMGGKGHVVEVGLSIASVAYGCLLGVFLLGTLTKFATEKGAAVGMVCGFGLNLALWLVPANANSGLTYTTPKETHYMPWPHIAFTWYVLIGALVTFALGALASLVFRRQSRAIRTTTAAPLLLLFVLLFPQGICVSSAAAQQSPKAQPMPGFSSVDRLIGDAIAQHKLPGAVLLVGHQGKAVYHHAYGNRRLAGEPDLYGNSEIMTDSEIGHNLSGQGSPQGKPSLPEAMTEDTIFDMASLTKDLATATAIMQLYEAGKLRFDAPVEQYLPEFNAAHELERAKVTLRMLLTHTSGEAPDVDLRDAWGLAKPDNAEGLRRAVTTALKAAPGSVFTYSDINFILLGAIVEKLSGQSEDVYAWQHIFKPLGMLHTRYHPALTGQCGVAERIGSAFVLKLEPHAAYDVGCDQDSWNTLDIENTAPTAHDNEGTAQTNPDFDRLLRGTVHDPTTRRMGGVAGHAGVFSTAQDVSRYASALLEKLLHNTGPFPLKQSTLQLMTTPQQPGHSAEQLAAARAAQQSAVAAGQAGSQPGIQLGAGGDALLAPAYPAIKGQNLRGFGWDIDTAFSKPRGRVFPVGSFGHTGFTGTSLWMDPGSETYVILLANAIHPRGGAPISNLRGEVATAAAQALGVGRGQ